MIKKNHQFAAICKLILGPSGKSFCCYGSVEIVFCRILFVDSYSRRKKISHESVMRYIGGQSTCPASIKKTYRQADGLCKLRSNVLTLIQDSVSQYKVLQIYNNVQSFAAQELPSPYWSQVTYDCTDDIHLVSIANYLAAVLHYVILTAA